MSAKLSALESCCIEAWRGINTEFCLNFKGVGDRCDIEKRLIRRVVRALARKGLLEYQRGLFDEYDGTVAGAGYGLTEAGQQHLDEVAA